MGSLNERLRDALLDRARAFRKQAERELGELGSASPGLRQAMDLVIDYAEKLAIQVDRTWNDAPETHRLGHMRGLAQHLRERVRLFDSRFKRGHLEVPQSLTAEIERECRRLGLSTDHAVISVGPPLNYVTFVSSLREYLFKDFDSDLAPDGADELVLIAIPELEGTRAPWLPLLGHEIAHYLQRALPITYSDPPRLDLATLASFTDPLPKGGDEPVQSRALIQMASSWLKELTCDAFALARYGASAIAAMADFSELAGARSAGYRHPPSAFRVRLMLEWLDAAPGSMEDEIVAPYRELAGQRAAEDWARYLCDEFARSAGTLWSDVVLWSRSEPYRILEPLGPVSQLVELFEQGVPGSETVRDGKQRRACTSPDVLNAAWLALSRRSKMPINRLAAKALDTIDFMELWREAGGKEVVLPPASIGPSLGVLSKPEIARRLVSKAKDRLVVTPLLPSAIGAASVDLRLGNQFIVFERSNAAAFDALSLEQDPRSMQRLVRKHWGDVFHLHPGQLVLASTLEYLTLPADLSAQVITRSSYGRLGLLSATAVQVHPHYAGCLTLELVNLGEMPMIITPGERVAQLVLTSVGTPAPPPDEDEKYRLPTAPEFSKIRTDAESQVLRSLRRGGAATGV